MLMHSIRSAPIILTLRGQGLQTSAETLGYGTVSSGASPEAGDLVIWLLRTFLSGGGQSLDATVGWTIVDELTSGNYTQGIVAKIVTASDISTPVDIITGGTPPDISSVWIAFSPSVPIVLRTTASTSGGGVGDPVAVSLDSTGQATPGVILSGHGTYNVSSTIDTAAWTGATEDATSTESLDNGERCIILWKIYGTTGDFGENITADMGDEGNSDIQSISGVWVEAA